MIRTDEIRRQAFEQIEQLRRLLHRVSEDDPDFVQKTLFEIHDVVWDMVHRHAGSDRKRHSRLIRRLGELSGKSYAIVTKKDPFYTKDTSQLALALPRWASSR